MTEPFPPNCPPTDASPKPGGYYRLGGRKHNVGDDTDASDWLRPYETRGCPCFRHPELPEAHGLSLFADFDDVLMAGKLSPWIGRKSVAQIEIGSSDGDLILSPTDAGESHHDWWTNPYDLLPSGLVVKAGDKADGTVNS